MYIYLYIFIINRSFIHAVFKGVVENRFTLYTRFIFEEDILVQCRLTLVLLHGYAIHHTDYTLLLDALPIYRTIVLFVFG